MTERHVLAICGSKFDLVFLPLFVGLVCRKHGFEIETATNAVELQEKLRDPAVELVVCPGRIPLADFNLGLEHTNIDPYQRGYYVALTLLDRGYEVFFIVLDTLCRLTSLTYEELKGRIAIVAEMSQQAALDQYCLLLADSG